MDSPLLTVCLITYNHENYIRQAIEGVLEQKTNFDWELLIADDYSTDDTRKIILDYKERYPEKIKLILQQKNVGPAKNWMDLITYPTSKYIAYFEGDDYWTDETKLQKQIDFLEANSDYNICFHKVKVIDKNGNDCGDIFEINHNFPSTTGIYQIARKNYIPTASIVYRNIIKKFPSWFFNVPMGDWPFFLLLSEKNKIFFIDEFMAVYRKHESSTWSSNNYGANHAKMMKARKILDKGFNYKYHKQIFDAEDMFKNEELLAEHYKTNKKFFPYIRSIMKLLLNKKSSEHSWGYYYLLLTRYFLKNKKDNLVR